MALIEWKNDYCVGIDEIDYDHQKLFDLIRQFVESLFKNQMTRVSAEILPPLVTHFKKHFAAEEKFMLKIKFPDYKRHKLLHESISKNIAAILVRIKKGKQADLLESMEIFSELMIEHIRKEDTKIARAFAVYADAGNIS